MLRTYEEIENFRANCVNHNMFDYFDAYDNLLQEGDGWDDDDELYNQIEKSLLVWIKENAKKDVYYRGDLLFEFESKKDRARFDAENGDPVAFKLMWT